MDLLSDVCHIWAPPPKMTVSKWASESFYISTGSEKGRFKPKAFQAEPLDCIADPRVKRIVIMSATQMLKTTLILVALAYVIAREPDPIMVVQPRDADVKKFSKFRLAPMLKDVPELQGKVAESRSRDTQSTIDVKDFPGGPLILTAAGSPGNLAAFPVRYLFCDEIDKYPLSAGAEGDPISLARKRLATYRGRSKEIDTCSPTEKKRSRIGKAYEESDQREFYVPCPNCQFEQILKWGQVKWDKGKRGEHKPETAYYLCENCGSQWRDTERWKAVNAGRWIAQGPFDGIAGFRIGELCSPWKKLSEIVADWLEKKDDPNQLRTFVNTSLCELWEEKGEAPESKRLFERSGHYQPGIVPPGVLFLTAAVDVQPDRLEFELKGWGRAKESWSVTYEVIQPQRQDSHGNMIRCRASDPEPWQRLAELIQTDWPCEGGGTMAIMCCAIDTGYDPERAYDFCRKYPQPAHGPAGSSVAAYRTVVPVKGGPSPFKLIENVSDTDAAKKRGGLKIVTIGTHNAKQEIYNLLRLDAPGPGQPFPPGYCHHPKYEEYYFEGLTAESRVIKENGAVEWRKDRPRNEPLDLHVYNRAAAELCGISRFQEQDWATLEAWKVDAARKVQLPAPTAAHRPGEVWPDAGGEQRETRAEQPQHDPWIPKRNWFNR